MILIALVVANTLVIVLVGVNLVSKPFNFVVTWLSYALMLMKVLSGPLMWGLVTNIYYIMLGTQVVGMNNSGIELLRLVFCI